MQSVVHHVTAPQTAEDSLQRHWAIITEEEDQQQTTDQPAENADFPAKIPAPLLGVAGPGRAQSHLCQASDKRLNQ